MAWITCSRQASPAACPFVSFTCLNLSRSITMTAISEFRSRKFFSSVNNSSFSAGVIAKIPAVRERIRLSR